MLPHRLAQSARFSRSSGLTAALVNYNGASSYAVSVERWERRSAKASAQEHPTMRIETGHPLERAAHHVVRRARPGVVSLVLALSLISQACASRTTTTASGAASRVSLVVAANRIAGLRIVPEMSYGRTLRYFARAGERGSSSFPEGLCWLRFEKIGLSATFFTLDAGAAMSSGTVGHDAHTPPADFERAGWLELAGLLWLVLRSPPFAAFLRGDAVVRVVDRSTEPSSWVVARVCSFAATSAGSGAPEVRHVAGASVQHSPLTEILGM